LADPGFVVQAVVDCRHPIAAPTSSSIPHGHYTESERGPRPIDPRRPIEVRRNGMELAVDMPVAVAERVLAVVREWVPLLVAAPDGVEGAVRYVAVVVIILVASGGVVGMSFG